MLLSSRSNLPFSSWNFIISLQTDNLFWPLVIDYDILERRWNVTLILALIQFFGSVMLQRPGLNDMFSLVKLVSA